MLFASCMLGVQLENSKIQILLEWVTECRTSSFQIHHPVSFDLQYCKNVSRAGILPKEVSVLRGVKLQEND